MNGALAQAARRGGLVHRFAAFHPLQNLRTHATQTHIGFALDFVQHAHTRPHTCLKTSSSTCPMITSKKKHVAKKATLHEPSSNLTCRSVDLRFKAFLTSCAKLFHVWKHVQKGLRKERRQEQHTFANQTQPYPATKRSRRLAVRFSSATPGLWGQGLVMHEGQGPCSNLYTPPPAPTLRS